MEEIDDELKKLAFRAVEDIMYDKLARVLAAYRAALAGIDYEEDMLRTVEAWFGDVGEWSDEKLNIWTGWRVPDTIFGPNYLFSCGHDTVLEALQHEKAQELHIEGRKVFERRDGVWHWVDEQK